MTTDEKRRLLRILAQRFHKENLHWALGASAMLFLRGRVKEFHDLDLFFSEKDIFKAKDILSSLGEPLEKEESSLFASRHFYTFSIHGLPVDLIEGFTILSQEKTYFFPLTGEEEFDRVQLDGVEVPLMELSDWEHYYTLMGRGDKAHLCRP